MRVPSRPKALASVCLRPVLEKARPDLASVCVCVRAAMSTGPRRTQSSRRTSQVRDDSFSFDDLDLTQSLSASMLLGIKQVMLAALADSSSVDLHTVQPAWREKKGGGKVPSSHTEG